MHAWIAGEGFRENFERHVALQLRVTSAIDLAHAARRKKGHNLVGTHVLTLFEQDRFDEQLCRGCPPRSGVSGLVMVRQK